MRLPDSLLNSVAFLAVDLGGEIKYVGTALLVSVPFRSTPERASLYLVTARHVVTTVAQHGQMLVRFNLKGGGVDLRGIAHEWTMHPDDAVDLAALPIALPTEVLFTHYAESTFVTDEKVADYGIGIGDEIAMAGLFHQREGAERNIPIVRSGIIAAMPDEPLVDKQGRPFDSYLIEVRSIGGLSGSPVFVILPPTRPLVEGITAPVPGSFHLLGIVRGHWNQDGLVSFNEKPTFLDIEQFNAGIASVTPMQQVAELLRTEPLVEHLDRQEQTFLAGRAPTEDSVPIGEPAGDATEFDHFQHLTRRLVAVPKKEADEARERET